MNYIQSLLDKIKKLIKSQKKYTNESIIELIFSKDYSEYKTSEDMYLEKFLNKFCKNLIKSQSNVSKENYEISNQLPNLLAFILITFKSMKEIIEKNRNLLIKLYNDKNKNNLYQNNNFLDNLIEDYLNVDNLFSQEFTQFLANNLKAFLNKSNNDKMSLFTFQQNLKEDLNTNYFEIFSFEELESFSHNLISCIYENIKNNLIDNFDSSFYQEDDEKVKEDTEFPVHDENNYLSSYLKIFVKSLNNLNFIAHKNYFDGKADIYNTYNKIVYFNGFIFDPIPDDFFFNQSKAKFEMNIHHIQTFNDLFRNQSGQKLNTYNKDLLFCCLICDNFFDFAKEKNAYEENAYGSIIIQDESKISFTKKLDFLSILSYAFSIKILISKVKVENFIKNYLRRYEIYVFDRISPMIFAEIKCLFDVKIIQITKLKELESLIEKFFNIIFCFKEDKIKATNPSNKSIILQLLNSFEFKTLNFLQNMIIVNNPKENFYIEENLPFENYIKSKYLIFGNTNKESNELLFRKIEENYNNSTYIENINHELLNDIFIYKDFNQNELIYFLNIILKNDFEKNILENRANPTKLNFLKYSPTTIIFNKLTGKINQKRIEMLNFILNKYSNLIIDKLNGEINAEYSSERLFKFKDYILQHYRENKINNVLRKDLFLIQEPDSIKNLFGNLLAIILEKYENFLFSNIANQSNVNENILFMNYLDNLLINDTNINGINDVINYLFNN